MAETKPNDTKPNDTKPEAEELEVRMLVAAEFRFASKSEIFLACRTRLTHKDSFCFPLHYMSDSTGNM
jgi:hypothetical protein